GEEMPKSGLATITHAEGGLFINLINSPFPLQKAVLPYIQKGISVPICMPNSHNSSKGLFSLYSRFIPLNVAAASVDPPARPAETGISLSIVIVTPCFKL